MLVAAVVVLGTLLLLVEVTARLTLFGIRGLDFRWINSMSHLWESELVQPAREPRIHFELRPDLDTLFRGARLVTNSAGLPDREYSLEKPTDTFRAVVVGSSWTMPSDVAVEHAWHSLLEDRFNEASTRTRFEFINFGVEHYGLGEIIATLELKAMAYDPDLIVFALTHYTPQVLWEDERSAFEPTPHPCPLLKVRSLGPTMAALRRLDARLGLGLPIAPADRRTQVKDTAEYGAQLRRAMRELNRIAGRSHVPVALVWLGFRAADPERRALLDEEIRRYGFPFIDTKRALRESGLSDRELKPYPDSRHPSVAGHRLLADTIEAQLLDEGLLAID